jgi:hypothetical protein
MRNRHLAKAGAAEAAPVFSCALHGENAINHHRQNCGAFPRLAVIKPKCFPIRANRRRFLG